eukprot:CAMPEP_0174711440 /NCGR_PEP_ID=MMETSP1094-20130205/12763_1 /TAXON_ID=156173 /ORGANISM="Chrysochromulina brevifilum, Strain UTEX LB 985" /LENGTH=39 /DNA_ID= /DNA_START= /DNA_END= /DNA_ORIENTATION=
MTMMCDMLVAHGPGHAHAMKMNDALDGSDAWRVGITGFF